jgi:hypothetical protein
MMEDPSLRMDRSKFAGLLRIPWLRAMTEKTIKSAFQNAGLIPFNPAVVLDNKSNFLTSANFAPRQNQGTPDQAADTPVQEEADEDNRKLGTDGMSDDEDVGAAEMLLHIGRVGSEEQRPAGDTTAPQPDPSLDQQRPASNILPIQIQISPPLPDNNNSPDSPEFPANGNSSQGQEEAINLQHIQQTQDQEEGTSLSMQPDLHQPPQHSVAPPPFADEQIAGAPTIEELEAQMELDPVQATVQTLPRAPPQRKRVTENMLVNANRMLTNPVLLDLKRQLEEEKREKERLAEERQAERERKKAEKEQQEEEKRRRLEERERQKKENKLKAQREKEKKAKRQEEQKRQREEKKRQEEEEKEARKREREAKKQQDKEEKEARRKRKEEEKKRKKEEQEAERAAKKGAGQGKAGTGGKGSSTSLLDESSRESWATHQAEQALKWAAGPSQASMEAAQNWLAEGPSFLQQWGFEATDQISYLRPFDFSVHTGHGYQFNSAQDMHQGFSAPQPFQLPTANRTWAPVEQLRFNVSNGLSEHGNRNKGYSSSDEEEYWSDALPSGF